MATAIALLTPGGKFQLIDDTEVDKNVNIRHNKSFQNH